MHTHKIYIAIYNHARPIHSGRKSMDRILIGQHVDEADWKHATPCGLALDNALHPVLVIGALVQHNQDLALLELQLVIVVRNAVIKGSAPPLTVL